MYVGTGHQITGQDSVNASKPAYRRKKFSNNMKQVIFQSSVGIGPHVGLPNCIKAFPDYMEVSVEDSNGFKLNMRGSSQHSNLPRFSVKSKGATRLFVLQGSDVMLF